MRPLQVSFGRNETAWTEAGTLEWCVTAIAPGLRFRVTVQERGWTRRAGLGSCLSRILRAWCCHARAAFWANDASCLLPQKLQAIGRLRSRRRSKGNVPDRGDIHDQLGASLTRLPAERVDRERHESADESKPSPQITQTARDTTRSWMRSSGRSILQRYAGRVDHLVCRDIRVRGFALPARRRNCRRSIFAGGRTMCLSSKKPHQRVRHAQASVSGSACVCNPRVHSRIEDNVAVWRADAKRSFETVAQHAQTNGGHRGSFPSARLRRRHRGSTRGANQHILKLPCITVSIVEDNDSARTLAR